MHFWPRGLLGGLVVLVGACQTTSPMQRDVFDNGVVRFRLPVPDGQWRRVQVDKIDVAWTNREGSSLLANAYCTGVDDAPLEVLTNHLFIGMTDRNLLQQYKTELSHREALVTDMDAKLDGVARRTRAVVVKKDGCVYDLVLSSPPEAFPEATEHLDALLAKFEILARPNRAASTPDVPEGQ